MRLGLGVRIGRWPHSAQLLLVAAGCAIGWYLFLTLIVVVLP